MGAVHGAGTDIDGVSRFQIIGFSLGYDLKAALCQDAELVVEMGLRVVHFVVGDGLDGAEDIAVPFPPLFWENRIFRSSIRTTLTFVSGDSSWRISLIVIPRASQILCRWAIVGLERLFSTLLR